ncbi:MAG: sigma-70 family RNA polymerase sigma factor [Planctomycetota bacterium]
MKNDSSFNTERKLPNERAELPFGGFEQPPAGAHDQDDAEFVSLLTRHQSQLKAFILASVGNFDHALDILQKTNLTIWQKSSEFRTGEPFLPWALAIARFEVLGFVRDRTRDRVVFQPDVSELLFEVIESQLDQLPARQRALHACLKRLRKEQAEIIRLRYNSGEPLSALSRQTGKTVDSLKSLLHRSRQKLKRCIELRIAQSG